MGWGSKYRKSGDLHRRRRETGIPQSSARDQSRYAWRLWSYESKDLEARRLHYPVARDR